MNPSRPPRVSFFIPMSYDSNPISILNGTINHVFSVRRVCLENVSLLTDEFQLGHHSHSPRSSMHSSRSKIFTKCSNLTTYSIPFDLSNFNLLFSGLHLYLPMLTEHVILSAKDKRQRKKKKKCDRQRSRRRGRWEKRRRWTCPYSLPLCPASRKLCSNSQKWIRWLKYTI